MVASGNTGMDEAVALRRISDLVPAAGDDGAVVGEHVLSTDMLHETTDFPTGTSRYTAGWRSVGASLSDVAAMGASAVAAVAAYGAPAFDPTELDAFLEGATAVCDGVDAEYVGGDLDSHGEFTVATTALGTTTDPVFRDGASPGEAVCVTGTLGRSAAALGLFDAGDHERANDLFRFDPRVAAGQALSGSATAMIDSSDGLARSLHQLATASDCGFAVETPLPVDDAVVEVARTEAEQRELATFFGEDFELVCTLPPSAVTSVAASLSVPLSRIGTVTGPARGVTLDGDALPNRGYTHDG